MGSNITATAAGRGTFTLAAEAGSRTAPHCPPSMQPTSVSRRKLPARDRGTAGREPLRIADVYAAGIGSDGLFLAKNFVLAKDIDASAPQLE